jgi:serine/threonine-protein kinase
VPYVALEYLRGQTLESLVEGGKPLPPALAFDIARQALSAIAYAHSHQVVHRDLKPENIFLAQDERGATIVKILDYGLAKFMAQESVLSSASAPLTGLGMVVGTPLYMPPEQAAGSSVDLAADVYSIGCVLFEMLAGRPPFMADTNVELINLHLRAPIPRLADALPGMRVAPELQALIDKALAKRQTERFPNATAMFEALNRLPAEPIAPIEATPRAPAAPSPAAKRSAEPEPARRPTGGGSARIWIALGALAAIGLWLAHSCG